ncbi:Chitinase 2 [Coemansia helicoidea]|uniref:Chitinase 2 n=1 Tax=Coemansia helicoidea TaxID=1286919 RepID=A0ACC1KY26_9FUNG|nr:Chitinase 2 [Coemansia helicoidea]
MGGASGAYGFSSEADGEAFADTTWNMFFKGNATQRPFDDAVLDGVDLDIEGGSSIGYTAFINQLRSHYKSDRSKTYYIAAAPQCPFPDAYLGPTLDSAWFDMVFVQFYNNYCGLNAYPRWFNFEDWDNWAKTKSANKDVKIFIGAPGSPTAASSGYADGAALRTVYDSVRSKYTSLGGVMTWDVSQARTSGLTKSIRDMLDKGKSCGSGGTPTPTPTNTTSDSLPPSTSTSTPGTSTHESPSSTATGIRIITATATETVTSLSTFVSSFWTTSTYTSTYTLHRTSVYTYTQTGSATTVQSPSSTSLTEAAVQTPGLSPSSCPVDGAPCVDGMQGCSDAGFALCKGGKWAMYPCLAGTKCFLLGGVALCDWGLSRIRKPLCEVERIQRYPTKLVTGVHTGDGSEHRAIYTARGLSTRIEYVLLSAVNDRYSALLKLQTLGAPFGNEWVLRLDLPAGQTVDHVDHSRVTTTGTSVTIQPDGTGKHCERMSVLLTVNGTYTGAYRTPDLTNAYFNLA